MFSKRSRFLDLKFLYLGWNYKLITTIMSLSLDERFWSWGKHIPTQFKWKISKVWAPPSHTPSPLPLPVLLQKHSKERAEKKQGREKSFLSWMQAKQEQVSIITRYLFSAQNTFWFLPQQAPAHSKGVTHKGKYNLYFRNFHDFYRLHWWEMYLCTLNCQ